VRPSEASKMTGVSAALQRDWRRRGILPQSEGDGWNSFQLSTVIEMTVMRAFTLSGLSIEAAHSLAGLSVLPVFSIWARWPDASIFVGDEISTEEMNEIRLSHVQGIKPEAGFSFVPMPELDGDSGAARISDLRLAEVIMNERSSFYGIVLDHYALALQIKERAPLPLWRWHISREN